MIHSRRAFLRQSAFASGALCLPGWLYKNVPNPGVQLWSVRDDMAKDPVGTLQKIAAMGFRSVEGFGYNNGFWGKTPRDFSRLLKELGLAMPSAHFNFSTAHLTPDGRLNDIALQAIEGAAEAGQRCLICAWLPEEERRKLPQLVEVFKMVAAESKKHGLRFGYHNHAFEFEIRHTDGRLMYEYLLHEMTPAEMAMEMDVYWVAYAGYNPLDWFDRHPGRFELSHMKDMAPTPARETIEVGDGVIDFKAILNASKKAGFQQHFIELEHYKTTPLDGIGRARRNFVKM